MHKLYVYIIILFSYLCLCKYYNMNYHLNIVYVYENIIINNDRKEYIKIIKVEKNSHRK